MLECFRALRLQALVHRPVRTGRELGTGNWREETGTGDRELGAGNWADLQLLHAEPQVADQGMDLRRG